MSTPYHSKSTVTAQGIHCGKLRVALAYGWAREIVETYACTRVPRAPDWLLGAASLSGVVTPVIDLELLLDDTQAEISTASRRRLLVGGVTDEAANNSLAIEFDGLPVQIAGEIEPISTDMALPKNLRELLVGSVRSANLDAFFLLDPRRLYEMVGARLA